MMTIARTKMYLVCEPRTGSTLAAIHFGINSEILLNGYEVIDDEIVKVGKAQNFSNQISSRKFIDKLQWLLLKRASGDTVYFKIISHNLTPYMKRQLTFYLKNEEVITIERNPWDTCMSYLFQEFTGWKATHNYDNNTIEKKYFTVHGQKIKSWCNKHFEHKQFIASLNNVKVIKYEDVCKFSPGKVYLKPSNIDYKECINNYDEAKTIFDEIMKNYA